MQITVDLHSHSGYAGGVGDISLKNIAQTMQYKGIDVYGTGDCLLPQRTQELKNEFISEEKGLFRIEGYKNAFFLLQTEIILTSRCISTHKMANPKKKTLAHHIVLFPDFESIEKFQCLMIKFKQKNTIGRPFIKTESQKELIDILFEIKNIHKYIEIIPAHIVTPDGLMGSANRLAHPREFYGEFFDEINALETGLSADPGMLSDIDGLNHLTMLSFSDGHSAALNRIGREFTVLNSQEFSYKGIIDSIRNRKVVYTAEFMPEEGRYHLTGHRHNRPNHHEDLYFLDEAPKDFICPVCQKPMTPGVKDWIKELPKTKDINRQEFVHLIPLVEIIAHSVNIKSVQSAKVLKIYFDLLKIFDTEINLWQASENDLKLLLTKCIDENIVNNIIKVKNQDFYYNPPGFDGKYGILKIN